MAGTIFDPGPPPLGTRAPLFVVYRNVNGDMQELPNVRFLGCRYDEGAMCGQAHYRYVFDEQGGVDVNREWPTIPADVVGPDAVGRYVVQPDDRLTSYVVDEDGNMRVLSDGFVTIPSAAFSGHRNQAASAILCMEVPIRGWDRPMVKRLQRDCDDPENPEGDTRIDLPIVFNPHGSNGSPGLGNATPEDADHEEDGFEYPCFLDEKFAAANDLGRPWTVPMAVKYILGEGNHAEEFVENPDFSTLDDLLAAREPKSTFMDANKSSTYESKPIILRETEIKGLEWPVALAQVLQPYGFNYEFALGTKDSGEPLWRLRIYRVQDGNKARFKKIFLQKGGDLDTSQTNIGEMHLSNDLNHLANEYVVESALLEVEASFVLTPGFVPDDGDITQPYEFDKTRTNSFLGRESLYRLYVFDETGEGHYDWDDPGELIHEATSLKDILGGEDHKEENYVKRRRKCRDTLISTHSGAGESTEKNKAIVHLSWDYTGPKPGLWDGSGTWYPVQGNWKFIDDGINVYIDCKNPNAWDTGNKKINFGVGELSRQGVVKGIIAQATPGETRFHLMVTTVIQGDSCIEATAKRRDASPTRFTVQRVIDARERYKKQVISAYSWYNQVEVDVIARDDTVIAKADAASRRARNEMARLAGPVTIPWITFAYSLGDRLTHVVGRDQSLRTNLGDSGGEGPSYPRIVAIEFKADPHPETVLHCEDDRGTVGKSDGRRPRRRK